MASLAEMRKRDVRGLRGWRSPLPRCEYHVMVSCLRPVVEQDQLDRFVASGGRKLGLDDGVGRLAGFVWCLVNPASHRHPSSLCLQVIDFI